MYLVSFVSFLKQVLRIRFDSLYELQALDLRL